MMSINIIHTPAKMKDAPVLSAFLAVFFGALDVWMAVVLHRHASRPVPPVVVSKETYVLMKWDVAYAVTVCSLWGITATVHVLTWEEDGDTGTLLQALFWTEVVAIECLKLRRDLRVAELARTEESMKMEELTN